MNYDKGLIAGSSALLVLSLLKEQERYGYELIKTLKDRSNDAFDFKEGTLYPILHKMENEGWIRSENKTVNGRTRRYYAITARGVKQLEVQQGTMVSFFLRRSIRCFRFRAADHEPIETYVQAVTAQVHFFLDRGRISDELRAHLQDSAEDLMQEEGLTPEQAQAEAAARMGIRRQSDGN